MAKIGTDVSDATWQDLWNKSGCCKLQWIYYEETLPRAQRTQGIDSMDWIVFFWLKSVWNNFSWKKYIPVLNSIPWVFCESGNVLEVQFIFTILAEWAKSILQIKTFPFFFSEVRFIFIILSYWTKSEIRDKRVYYFIWLFFSEVKFLFAIWSEWDCWPEIGDMTRYTVEEIFNTIGRCSIFFPFPKNKIDVWFFSDFFVSQFVFVIIIIIIIIVVVVRPQLRCEKIEEDQRNQARRPGLLSGHSQNYEGALLPIFYSLPNFWNLKL